MDATSSRRMEYVKELMDKIDVDKQLPVFNTKQQNLKDSRLECERRVDKLVISLLEHVTGSEDVVETDDQTRNANIYGYIYDTGENAILADKLHQMKRLLFAVKFCSERLQLLVQLYEDNILTYMKEVSQEMGLYGPSDILDKYSTLLLFTEERHEEYEKMLTEYYRLQVENLNLNKEMESKRMYTEIKLTKLEDRLSEVQREVTESDHLLTRAMKSASTTSLMMFRITYTISQLHYHLITARGYESDTTDPLDQLSEIEDRMINLHEGVADLVAKMGDDPMHIKDEEEEDGDKTQSMLSRPSNLATMNKSNNQSDPFTFTVPSFIPDKTMLVNGKRDKTTLAIGEIDKTTLAIGEIDKTLLANGKRDKTMLAIGEIDKTMLANGKRDKTMSLNIECERKLEDNMRLSSMPEIRANRTRRSFSNDEGGMASNNGMKSSFQSKVRYSLFESVKSGVHKKSRPKRNTTDNLKFDLEPITLGTGVKATDGIFKEKGHNSPFPMTTTQDKSKHFASCDKGVMRSRLQTEDEFLPEGSVTLKQESSSKSVDLWRKRNERAIRAVNKRLVFKKLDTLSTDVKTPKWTQLY